MFKGSSYNFWLKERRDRLKLQWSYTFRLNFCVLWIMFQSTHKELSWLERNAIWSALQTALSQKSTLIFILTVRPWWSAEDCMSQSLAVFYFYYFFFNFYWKFSILFIHSYIHDLFSESLLSARHWATHYRCNKPFASVQFSHSVVSDSLWPHESQHTRPPCPSPTPGVHSDSHPLN